MIGKVLTITPTGEKSEDGYKIAIARLYNAPKTDHEFGTQTNNEYLVHEWTIDCFHTVCMIQADFECDGGVKIWHPNGHYLDVAPYFDTYIREGEKIRE